MPGNIKLYCRTYCTLKSGDDPTFIAFSERRRSSTDYYEVQVYKEVAMNISEELLFDFSINMPRLLISGKTGIFDNVKKIVMISENSIVVDHGNRFSAVSGAGLRVKLIEEERMIVTGDILSVEFYSGKKGESNEE